MCGLIRGTANTGNLQNTSSSFLFVHAHSVCRQAQYRFKQPGLWIVNSKLRCVNSHSYPASASCAVVARQRGLPSFIQLAIGVQGQWMGWNDTAPQEGFSNGLNF